MKTLPDNILIDQLKNEDNTSFEILYRFYFPTIASYIKQNMGGIEDAEDIFQETIIVLLKKLRQTDFELTSSLKTYLFAISKNLWLKRLRNKSLISVADFEKYQLQTDVFSVEIQPEKTKEEKVDQWLSKVTTHCQGILKALFFFHEPMESLMKKMGWKNKKVAANQQYKCIQQVKKEKGA